jgi:uncharacterized membrane protein YeaQ/YmgE (transglycosylase-associated protein family)
MTALIIMLAWVLPVVAGGITGIVHDKIPTGVLWPLFLGWIGFLVAFYLIYDARKPPAPPEQHPGYVAGLKNGE